MPTPVGSFEHRSTGSVSGEIVLRHTRQEYAKEHRLDGVLLRLEPKYVTKDYSHTAHADAKMQHLELVDGVLTSYRAPNAEMLMGMDQEAQVVAFQPRGESCQPCNLFELYDGLVNVLEMLEVLQKAGLMHRLITWSSIRKRFGTGLKSAWFVANFDFAAPVRSRVHWIVLRDGQRTHLRCVRPKAITPLLQIYGLWVS